VTPQSQIAHYRITAKLGEGGMGEVWRATDTKLNREVAIKILPEALAADPDRLARFQREAQVLASLNHPNVAQIHGVEERALVMELVEGETLAGPLSEEQALPLIEQLIDALEYAHEKCIVHRDLKPANIKITPQGKLKVLDFGLAKAMTPETAAPSPLSSPTLTMRATQLGVILGTAAYMAPEQARGHEVDKRADIWAFGVVLYEMLTARLLFGGATVSDTLAAVLRQEPELDRVPPRFRKLLRLCLEKDPRRRLRDIGDARALLEETAPGPSGHASVARSWPLRTAAALTLALGALAFLHFTETHPEPRVVRSYIPPPEGAAFAFTTGLPVSGPVALSPDGRRMTFSATTADGKLRLWLRPLDALTAQPLAGTEDAIHPFWSPDSRYIAFFAGGKLKKIDASGGPPVVLCDAASGRGGTWNQENVIVFVPSGSASGFLRVSASGGVPSVVPVDVGGRWPWFLPDGRHFLYAAVSAVRLASLDSRQTKPLIGTPSDAAYAQGHLLYLRDSTLMAQPFDLKRLALSGEPVPVAENVRSVGLQRRGIFSVSQNGLLAYQSGIGSGQFQLTWFDRAGKRLSTLGEPAGFFGFQLSPDGRSAVADIVDPATNTGDLWLYDVARALRKRFTFDNGGTFSLAAWSPDGTAIVFDSLTNGKYGLYRKPSNLSGGAQLLYAGEARILPTSWSPDGKLILAVEPPGRILTIPSADPKPSLVATINTPSFPRFSTDGRWMAYSSLDSGRSEIYVVPFPGPGGKVQVSSAGGTQPRWRRDGKEIFYVAPDGRLTAAEITFNGGSLEVGRVQPLFGGIPSVGALAASYDVAADGQRFLVEVPIGLLNSGEPLTLVQNWTAGWTK
jgi:Tol biopolymer transport system component